MNNSGEVNWEQSIWDEINDAVKMEMGKVRIAQKVFPTMMFDMNPTEVPNDVINFENNGLSIQEGRTKPFVEIYQEFPLTSTQVSKESQMKTCKILARMAAKAIALAEDTIIFQGNKGRLPGNIGADQRNSTEGGLLGEANPCDEYELKLTSIQKTDDLPEEGKLSVNVGKLSVSVGQGKNTTYEYHVRIFDVNGEPIKGTFPPKDKLVEELDPLIGSNLDSKQKNEFLQKILGRFDYDDNPNKVTLPIVVDRLSNSTTSANWGENVFSAVADGISSLTSKAQAQNYALFLPTKVYADTFIPPSSASLVTTAERIRPLVEGGFYGTGTLPKDEGLLVALAGDPTSLYLGREATTEFVRKEGSKYFFRVVERIQFVARDPRAFVLLKFEQP